MAERILTYMNGFALVLAVLFTALTAWCAVLSVFVWLLNEQVKHLTQLVITLEGRGGRA